MLPHLDAAYNLARWLTRDDQDAQDVVQEAMLRALRYFWGLRGENARPWLLAIVRHTTYGWLRDNRPAMVASLDAEEGEAAFEPPAPEADEPHVAAALRDERAQVNWYLAALPALPRGAAARDGRPDLSRHRRHRPGADRHRDVAPGARPCPAARGVATRSPPGPAHRAACRQRGWTDMNTPPDALQLNACVDGELELTRQPSWRRRTTPPQSQLERLRALRATVRAQADYHAAPAALKQRMQALLRAEAVGAASAIRGRWRWTIAWPSFAAKGQC